MAYYTEPLLPGPLGDGAGIRKRLIRKRVKDLSSSSASSEFWCRYMIAKPDGTTGDIEYDGESRGVFQKITNRRTGEELYIRSQDEGGGFC